MSEFTANWNERIPKGIGLNVYEDGEKLGESEHEKGSWWSGWKYKDEYYLMLSDEYDACWKVDKKTVEDYCL